MVNKGTFGNWLDCYPYRNMYLDRNNSIWQTILLSGFISTMVMLKYLITVVGPPLTTARGHWVANILGPFKFAGSATKINQPGLSRVLYSLHFINKIVPISVTLSFYRLRSVSLFILWQIRRRNRIIWFDCFLYATKETIMTRSHWGWAIESMRLSSELSSRSDTENANIPQQVFDITDRSSSSEAARQQLQIVVELLITPLRANHRCVERTFIMKNAKKARFDVFAFKCPEENQADILSKQ